MGSVGILQTEDLESSALSLRDQGVPLLENAEVIAVLCADLNGRV